MDNWFKQWFRKELALKFAQEGWQVGISARRMGHLINISKLNKNIHVFQLDIKNKMEVKKTFKKILKKKRVVVLLLLLQHLVIEGCPQYLGMELQKLH